MCDALAARLGPLVPGMCCSVAVGSGCSLAMGSKCSQPPPSVAEHDAQLAILRFTWKAEEQMAPLYYDAFLSIKLLVTCA